MEVITGRGKLLMRGNENGKSSLLQGSGNGPKNGFSGNDDSVSWISTVQSAKTLLT